MIWMFWLFFYFLTYSEEQSVLKLTATFNVAWRTVASKPRGSSNISDSTSATNSVRSSSINLRCWWTAGCSQQGDSQSRAHRCLVNNFPFFFLFFSLLVWFANSLRQSSFDGGNLVFSPDGLCNYVEHAYRLLCKMPLKHLHSAKVHIRELSLKPAELSEVHPVILSPPAAASDTLGKTCCPSFPTFCLYWNVWCEHQQGAMC